MSKIKWREVFKFMSGAALAGSFATLYMTTVAGQVIALCWAVFCIYWIIAAFGTKRTALLRGTDSGATGGLDFCSSRWRF
jgi:hypothetical protein